MNNDEQRLLEAATAKLDSTEASNPSPESLRPAYVALAKALQAQEEAWDGSQMIAFADRLRATLHDLPVTDVEETIPAISLPVVFSQPKKSNSSAWWAYSGGLLALSVLIGFILIRQNMSAIKSVPMALPPSVPTMPQQAIAKTVPLREVKPKKLPAHSPNSKLAANRVWKDPLDQRIAKASTKVHWRMAEATSACDGSLEKLDRKLGKMAREMSRSTL